MAPALAPGDVVAGRYEVRRLLGRGGMGEVWRAFDRVLDEEVALKVLGQATERMRARFRSEIKLARQVSHVNVCRIHDYGEDGSLRWISMELVEGQTLKERLTRGPLPRDQAYSVAIQAAEGLAAVHDAGIVHRDLKTLNLMSDATGRVRVMDFGIAKSTGASETVAGSYVLGSPEYMSPEQARNRPTDASSDVYSLGVVVFELFTGEVPFRADTPVATLLLHLETPPPLDHTQLPSALRPVLERALAKDPRRRIASARELAAALRAAQQGAAAAPPRSRRAAVWLAVALIAAAGFSAALFVSRAPLPVANPPPADAAAEAERAGAEPPAAGETPASEASPRATVPPPRQVRNRAAGAAIDVLTIPPTPVPPSSVPPPTPPTSAPAPAGSLAVPPAAPETTTPAAPTGALLVLVTPWADVSVDGVLVGQTPLARIPLEPGARSVLLSHPDYQPYVRRVTIRPGETHRLVVDLRTDGVRRVR